MRTIIKMICVLSFVVSLLACEKENDQKSNNSDNLIGYWINPQINDTIWTHDKTDDLKDNNYGFAFKAEQNFIEKKNSGWCGTPPIAYSDFEGTWYQNDSILNITVGYWGGTVDYQWKTISIEKNTLKIYKMNEEYHNEE